MAEWTDYIWRPLSLVLTKIAIAVIDKIRINKSRPNRDSDVDTIKVLTQEEYDTLPQKDERTLYLIKKSK